MVLPGIVAPRPPGPQVRPVPIVPPLPIALPIAGPSSRPRMSLFERLGVAVHRHRRAVLGAWLLVILAALPFAPRVGSALRAGGFSTDSLESVRARAVLATELDLPPSALLIVFHSDTLNARSQPFEAAAAE